jgi:hypothetical protein
MSKRPLASAAPKGKHGEEMDCRVGYMALRGLPANLAHGSRVTSLRWSS